MTQPTGVVDSTTLADAAGLKPGTIRQYLKISRQRVDDGLDLRPTDLPLPDGRAGRSPFWFAATVDRWLSARAHQHATADDTEGATT